MDESKGLSPLPPFEREPRRRSGRPAIVSARFRCIVTRRTGVFLPVLHGSVTQAPAQARLRPWVKPTGATVAMCRSASAPCTAFVWCRQTITSDSFARGFPNTAVLTLNGR